jgi:hypothetical protein
MRIRFKITTGLLASIRADLGRPHAFAYERVGFISAAVAWSAWGVLVLAQEHHPVADEDYLPDPSVGAMMGPEAIRKAMELAFMKKVSIFHVHSHGGLGIPGFSGVDLRETAKFVPDFLKVAPEMIHGSVVLSDDAAAGQFWVSGNSEPEDVNEFVEVGAPMRKWSSS